MTRPGLILEDAAGEALRIFVAPKAVLRADRLGEALAALPERGVAVFPLWPKAGVSAKRVILQARQGSRAPLQMLAGLVLHEPDGAYTAEADAVLRGRGLTF